MKTLLSTLLLLFPLVARAAVFGGSNFNPTNTPTDGWVLFSGGGPIEYWGPLGSLTGAVSQAQLINASNVVHNTSIANDTTTSNGVVSLLIANDTTTSNSLYGLTTKAIYLDPSGNDANAGTRASPMASLDAAVQKAGSGGAVIMLAGTYLPGKGNLNAVNATNVTIAADGIVNCNFGTNVLGFTQVSGGLYSFQYDSKYWSNISIAETPYIFEYGTPEGFTGVVDRDPLQFNSWYRNRLFTRLTNAPSLATVANGGWFASNDNATVFFQFADGGSTNSARSIYLPSKNRTNSVVYNGTNSTSVRIVGVNALFGFNGFDCSSMSWAETVGCLAAGNYNEGFNADTLRGRFTLTGCEAYGNNNDGAGYSAAAIGSSTDRTNVVIVQEFGCWFHDNGDEGTSMHYGGLMEIQDGLYEFNTRSGGVTPYAGTRVKIANTVIRKNDVGIALSGSPDRGGLPGPTNLSTIVSIRNSDITGNRIGSLAEQTETNLILRASSCYWSNTFNVLFMKAQTNFLFFERDCTFNGAGLVFFDPDVAVSNWRDPEMLGATWIANAGGRVWNANEGLGYVQATLTNGCYADLRSDRVIGFANNASSAVNRTNFLPSATVNSGRTITVVDIGGTATGSNIWVKTIASQTINGGPTITNISVDYGQITLLSDGTGWRDITAPRIPDANSGGGSTNVQTFASGYITTGGIRSTNAVFADGGITIVGVVNIATGIGESSTNIIMAETTDASPSSGDYILTVDVENAALRKTLISSLPTGIGTPAGNSGAVQFNQSTAFAGTNDFLFDRTNSILAISQAAAASSGGILVRLVGTTSTNDYTGVDINHQGANKFQIRHAKSGNTGAVYVDTNNFSPDFVTTPQGMDLGSTSGNAAPWRSLLVTNVTIYGGTLGAGKVLTDVSGTGVGTWQAPATGSDSSNHVTEAIGQLTTTNSTVEVPLTLFQIGTNLLTGTNMSGRYVASLRSSGPTNIAIYPGAATTRLELWTTNGTTVNLLVDTNGSSFPASWYIGGVATTISTNGLTVIDVWTNSLGTNVLVFPARDLIPAAGNGIAYDSNLVANVVTQRLSGVYTGSATNIGAFRVTGVATLESSLGVTGSSSLGGTVSLPGYSASALLATDSSKDMISSPIGTPSGTIVSNVQAVMFSTYTNYSATVSNFVFGFGTNSYELVVATNLNFTNITMHSRAPTAVDMRVLIRPINQNLTVVWPAAGVNHLSYNWRTNANNTLWTTLTNAKVYVVAMTSIGTNLFPTITLWE